MKTLNVFDPIHTSLTEPILIEASAGTGKTYSFDASSAPINR